jgi:hypothetical protein
MAGTITTSTIQNDTSSPPTFRNNSVEIGTLCRAWVNFNGTGTVAIRASFNVSSITDNGTGDYTINFTTALPDANYNAVFGARGNPTVERYITEQHDSPLRSTTQLRIYSQNLSRSLVDAEVANVSVFR